MGTDPVEPPDFIDPERPWEYIGNGRFRHVSTGEIITDPNYDPNNDLYEVGGIYSRGDEESLDPDEPEPDPVDVVVGPRGRTEQMVETELMAEMVLTEETVLMVNPDLPAKMALMDAMVLTVLTVKTEGRC